MPTGECLTVCFHRWSDFGAMWSLVSIRISGGSLVLTRYLREKIEALIPEWYGELEQSFAVKRRELKCPPGQSDRKKYLRQWIVKEEKSERRRGGCHYEIGTRKSRLAMRQTEMAWRRPRRSFSHYREIEIAGFETKGDLHLINPCRFLAAKELFAKGA